MSIELHVSLKDAARIKLQDLTRSFTAFDGRIVGTVPIWDLATTIQDRGELPSIEMIEFSLDHIYIFDGPHGPWKPVLVRGVKVFLMASNIASLVEQPFRGSRSGSAR